MGRPLTSSKDPGAITCTCQWSVCLLQRASNPTYKVTPKTIYKHQKKAAKELGHQGKRYHRKANDPNEGN